MQPVPISCEHAGKAAASQKGPTAPVVLAEVRKVSPPPSPQLTPGPRKRTSLGIMGSVKSMLQQRFSGSKSGGTSPHPHRAADENRGPVSNDIFRDCTDRPHPMDSFHSATYFPMVRIRTLLAALWIVLQLNLCCVQIASTSAAVVLGKQTYHLQVVQKPENFLTMRDRGVTGTVA